VNERIGVDGNGVHAPARCKVQPRS
jgi:hypothetical protein